MIPSITRLGAALGILLATVPAWAAGKPVIEIRAVVDCAGPDSMKLPGADAGCMTRSALVKGADFTGIGHVRFARDKDLLVVAMNGTSAKRFYAFTRAHAQKPVAVLIDGRLISMPVLSEPAQPASLEIPGLTGPQIDSLVMRFRGPGR